MTKKVTGTDLKKLLEVALGKQKLEEKVVKDFGEKFLDEPLKKFLSKPPGSFAKDANNPSLKSTDRKREFEKYFPEPPTNVIDDDDLYIYHTAKGYPIASGDERKYSIARLSILIHSKHKAQLKKLSNPNKKVKIDGTTNVKMPEYWVKNVFPKISAADRASFSREEYGRKLAQMFLGAKDGGDIAGTITKKFGVSFQKTPVPAAVVNPGETFADIGISSSGASKATPAMSQDEVYLLENFFTLSGTSSTNAPADFLTRIKAISNFSEKIAKRSDLTALIPAAEKAKFLNYVLMMQYINKLVRESDNQGAAYDFEAFCAFLAGGKKAGGESGAAGGMGEADFFFGDGTKGSAKYYKKLSGISQADKNFELNVPVVYVIANKKQVSTTSKVVQLKTGEGETKIHRIDFHMLVVERVKDSFISYDITKLGTKTTKAKNKNYVTVVGTDVKFTGVPSAVATLTLTSTDESTIDQNLANLNSATNTAFGTIINNVKKVFASLSASKSQIINYSSSGDFSKGVEAMKSLNTSRNDLASLSTDFDPKKAIDKNVVEEQKITANFLKKLISESFKR
jgi:hypothetical protein